MQDAFFPLSLPDNGTIRKTVRERERRSPAFLGGRIHFRRLEHLEERKWSVIYLTSVWNCNRLSGGGEGGGKRRWIPLH